MSLPSAQAVAEFMRGLGETADAVAASLQEMGARDAPGIPGAGGGILHCCAVAQAFRIKFPELNDAADWSWAVGPDDIRIGHEYVPVPAPLTEVINAVDDDRPWQHRRPGMAGRDHGPRYPFLLAEGGS